MEISLLGPLEVRSADGAPVDLGGVRLRRLLIRLALDPARPVPVSALVDAVWATDVPANAANALQALVSRLRRAGVPVDATPGGYLLRVAPEEVDAVRFERFAAAGDAAAAVALWRGEPEYAEEDFARATVVRWHALLADVREAALEDKGQAGIAEIEELAAAAPLRSGPVGLLMRALVAAGRDGEALAAYEKHRELLADELGADPPPELQRLHVDILRGEAARPARNNLPAALSSFVGRDEDVARVRDLVRQTRLTTLTGPGGSGKTRLAIESARGLPEAFPDGVWLVELAPVTKPEDVPAAVVGAIGARARSFRKDLLLADTADPVEQAVRAFAGQRALLVLDNCEHVIGAAADLADELLAACPGLRVLATSREALGLAGEALWPVEPLALPPADAELPVALTFPVVQLLRERARSVRPDFEIDGYAVAICRALDGMPLAIELAAARLRSMPAQQLAERLDDRFRLLRGGARTALPRHQTLRGVIDWSWDLLGDEERRAWRRLALCTSTISIELAEALTGADVLDVLGALVDKSLLRMEGDRYRMLETIREYGLERLAEAGEVAEARKAWTEYFVGLGVVAEPHLRTAGQLPWLRLIEAEHDNMLSVLRWAIAHGQKETALRLVVGLGWSWWLRGFRREAARLTEAALALPGAAPVVDQALAMLYAAIIDLESQGSFARAAEQLRQAAELARGHEQEHPMLRLAEPMRALMTTGYPSGGIVDIETFVPFFDDPDPWLAATARAMHAHALVNMGEDRERAKAEFMDALARFRAVGDRWGLTLVLDALATFANNDGDHATAAACSREALILAEEIGAQEDLIQQRCNLAWTLWLQGEHDQARELLAEAQRAADRVNLPQVRAILDYGFALLARLDGDLPGALRRLRTARRTIHEFVVAPQFRAMIGASEALVLSVQGDPQGARRALDDALDEALSAGDAPIVGLVLVAWAGVELHADDATAAATLLGAAAAVVGTVDRSLVDRPPIEAGALAALGRQGYDEAFERGSAYTMDTVRDLVGPRAAA
ncbi:MAG: AAA family ATPase [Hamadaea sp.]|nr:AAA family ATPase [Hamadaea sp.]